MAIKQNPDTNETVGPNAGTNTTGSGGKATAGTGVGAGTLTKNGGIAANNSAAANKLKMNPSDGDNGGNNDGQGHRSNGAGDSANGSRTIIDMDDYFSSNNVILSSGGMGALGNAKPSDISDVLALIELVHTRCETLNNEDYVRVYRHTIFELAKVIIPRQTPEDLKRFKDDIAKVGDFLAKNADKRGYMYMLRVVCALITGDNPKPSCAVAIIFQLFDADSVVEAVRELLDLHIPDHNIRKTVKILCEWLRICNFCQNLNLWILTILNGLCEQHKFNLITVIALENIDQLFFSLIVPVLRPKVAYIIFHLLSSITHTPLVFHKILPKFPRVISSLKQQANSMEDYALDTKKLLQQLVDLTSALMVRFYGFDELYEPIEAAMREFRPSGDYMNYVNHPNGGEKSGLDVDIFGCSANVKVGLVNLGNTCYMNSVLQALAMTKEFSREILLTQCKSPVIIKMQQQIALMLYSSRYELTPSRVLNATRPPGFAPGLQQDSSEFLDHLLEVLHEQEVTYLKNPNFSGSDEIDGANEHEAENETTVGSATPTAPATEVVELTQGEIDAEPAPEHEPVSEPEPELELEPEPMDDDDEGDCNSPTADMPQSMIVEDEHSNGNGNGNMAVGKMSQSRSGESELQSTIDKTFTGKLIITYKCSTCGWESRHQDIFRDMQLSFPESKSDCISNYSVQDLIDYYCSPEKLYGENQYFCERCKLLTDAERFIHLTSAPKNLILTLKHFKYDQKYHMRAKLMHKVFHDEKVSLKICAPDTLEEVANVHYDLYAGVVHSGFSMDSGHYYTYAADSSKAWYKFNDSVVTTSTSEELHNLTPPNTPYILFYRMVSRTSDPVEAIQSNFEVEQISPLKLEDLPRPLREYVVHDNSTYNEEVRVHRFKQATAAFRQSGGAGQSSGHGSDNSRSRDFNDDDDENPPPTGCGGNALNMNVNRFVY